MRLAIRATQFIADFYHDGCLITECEKNEGFFTPAWLVTSFHPGKEETAHLPGNDRTFYDLVFFREEAFYRTNVTTFEKPVLELLKLISYIDENAKGNPHWWVWQALKEEAEKIARALEERAE
jgi:hypothetical protein